MQWVDHSRVKSGISDFAPSIFVVVVVFSCIAQSNFSWFVLHLMLHSKDVKDLRGPKSTTKAEFRVFRILVIYGTVQIGHSKVVIDQRSLDTVQNL